MWRKIYERIGRMFRKTVGRDDRVWIVSERVVELQRAVDDAAWNGDSRLGFLAAELAHFRQLESEGKLYEPKF